jgi:hypothetical protein
MRTTRQAREHLVQRALHALPRRAARHDAEHPDADQRDEHAQPEGEDLVIRTDQRHAARRQEIAEEGAGAERRLHPIDDPGHDQDGQHDRQKQHESGKKSRNDAVTPEFDYNVHRWSAQFPMPTILRDFAAIVLSLCKATLHHPGKTLRAALKCHLSHNWVNACRTGISPFRSCHMLSRSCVASVSREGLVVGFT